MSSFGVMFLRLHSFINLSIRWSGSPNSWIFSTDIVPPSNAVVKGKSSAISTTALLQPVKSQGCALIENPCPLACCQQGIGACPVRLSCKDSANHRNILKNTKTYRLLESRRNQTNRAVLSHYLRLRQQVQIIFALLGASESAAAADCKTLQTRWAIMARLGWTKAAKMLN